MAFSFMQPGGPMSGLSAIQKIMQGGGQDPAGGPAPGGAQDQDPNQALQALLMQFAGAGGKGIAGGGGSADLSRILPMLQSMFGGG